MQGSDNFLRVVKRAEVLKCCDPEAGDPPNFTAEERRSPVKLELNQPIQVDGESRYYVIVQPTTKEFLNDYLNYEGEVEEKNLRLASACVGLPESVIFWMNPDDFANLLAILVEFNLNLIDN